MKEASLPPSPFFTSKTPNAVGAAAAVRSPAEKQTPAAPGRVKSFCCSASLSSSPSSNSSSSSFSSQLGSPMTPPSPFCSSSSVIPFSWEKQPGVPKLSQHPKERRRCPDPTLPPPPPLRSNSDPFLSLARKKRPQLRFAADPFTVALMECSKDDPAAAESPGLQWKGTAAASRFMGGRRRTIAALFGFVDMYTSCKTTCSVADSMVYIPRSGRGMAAYGLLSRRTG